MNLSLSGQKVRECRTRAIIWHMPHVDTGHASEQLPREMGRRANPGRSNRKLAGIAPRLVQQLGKRPSRKCRVHDNKARLATDARDRQKVANEIEFEVIMQRRAQKIARSRE